MIILLNISFGLEVVVDLNGLVLEKQEMLGASTMLETKTSSFHSEMVGTA